MKILHGQLQRLNNQNVIKENPPPPLHTDTHIVNAIELQSNTKRATPHFYINSPFSGLSPLLKGGGGPTMLHSIINTTCITPLLNIGYVQNQQ